MQELKTIETANLISTVLSAGTHHATTADLPRLAEPGNNHDKARTSNHRTKKPSGQYPLVSFFASKESRRAGIQHQVRLWVLLDDLCD